MPSPPISEVRNPSALRCAPSIKRNHAARDLHGGLSSRTTDINLDQPDVEHDKTCKSHLTPGKEASGLNEAGDINKDMEAVVEHVQAIATVRRLKYRENYHEDSLNDQALTP